MKLNTRTSLIFSAVFTSLFLLISTQSLTAEARGKRKRTSSHTPAEMTESNVIPAHPQPVDESATHSKNEVMSAYEDGTDPHENWKGQSERNRFEVGALGGLGNIRGINGFALMPTAAIKTHPDGFLDDIADSVSIEVQGGPVFMSGGRHPFMWSAHMRWDFRMNSQWTFYGLGGLGGYLMGDGLGNTDTGLYFRPGLGAMMDIGKIFSIRGEVSHELIAAGVSVPLF